MTTSRSISDTRANHTVVATRDGERFGWAAADLEAFAEHIRPHLTGTSPDEVEVAVYAAYAARVEEHLDRLRRIGRTEHGRYASPEDGARVVARMLAGTYDAIRAEAAS